MLVSNSNLSVVLDDIFRTEIRGFDTETYGLKYFDRMFALIISTQKDDYYFNFNAELDHKKIKPEVVLDRSEIIKKLQPMFPWGIWASHNAKFDIGKLMLEAELPPMHVHCTLATERLIRNDRMDYSLEAVAPLYGLEKDDTVEKYIMEHKLYTNVRIPGKKHVEKNKHFDKVPLNIIQKYGERDARIHLEIGIQQRKQLNLCV